MAKVWSDAEKGEIVGKFSSNLFYLTVWRNPNGRTKYTLKKSWQDKYVRGKWNEQKITGAEFELYFVADLMRQYQNSQRVKK